MTKARDKRQEENENLYAKIESGEIRNRDKAIAKINNSYKPHIMYVGGQEIRDPDRYSNGILIGKPDNDNFERIFKSFSEKIKKLNSGGYKKYKKS